MTSLRALLSTLASQAGPVLTVYSKERVEFNGPVLARWFSKISNLLSEELGADLFGEGEAHRGRFFIRHELWQEIVWTVPLLALGWTRLASLEDAAPGDLVLVSTIDEDALAAYESGATVVAQPREYLAFSWRGDPLPDGILDALAEVMAQPDTLEGDVPLDAPSIEEIASSLERSKKKPEEDAPPRTCNSRLLFRAGVDAMPVILRGWCTGSSFVLADPTIYSTEGMRRIANSEGAVLL